MPMVRLSIILQMNFGSAKASASQIKTAASQLQQTFKNNDLGVLGYMRSLGALAVGESYHTVLSKVICPAIAKGLFAKHVEGYGDGDADEALKRLGIEEGMDGLNFIRSEMFSAENPNQIHLVCYYTVRMSPLIDLPGEGRIVLCKESVTNAWINGLGKKAIDEGDGAGEEKPEEKTGSIAGKNLRYSR